MLLAGEAGLGKTRLAAELAERAKLLEAELLWGSCSAAEPSLPYLPFLEALGNYLASGADSASHTDMGAIRDALEYLFPRLSGTRSNENGQSLRLNHKLRLYEGVLALIGQSAMRHGSLFVLEDLHWADVASLELLDYVARRLRTRRVLILGTYRDEEVDGPHPLRPLLHSWQRSRLATVLDLKPLTKQEAAKMVRLICQEDAVPSTALDALYRRSQGNPLALEELASSVLERESRPPSKWDRALMHEPKVPDTVKQAVLMRLERLPRKAMVLLHHAAILGESFDYDSLVALAGCGEANARSVITMAIRHRFLVDDGATGQLSFRHALTRDAIYESLAGPERSHLHGVAADVLARSPDVPAIVLCQHLLLAGRHQQALPRCLEAAEAAMRAFAYGDAVQLYQRALPHMAEPRERGRILCRLGEASRLNSDTATAAQYLEEAVQLLTRVGSPQEVAAGRLQLGDCYWESSRYEECEGQFELARQLLEDEGQSPDLATTYVKLAGMRNHWYDAPKAMTLSERAIQMSEEVGADPPRLEAQLCRGWSLNYLGQVDDSLACFDGTHLEAVSLGLNQIAANALYGSVMVRLTDFRLAEARDRLKLLRTTQAGNWLARNGEMMEGLYHSWGVGQPRVALGLLEGALADAREGGAVAWATWIETNLALVYAELGRLRDARKLLSPEWVKDPQHRRMEMVATMRIFMELGERDAALRAARAAVECPDFWPRAVRRFVSDSAVEVFLAYGDVAAAEKACAATTDQDTGSGRPYQLRMEGLVALANNDLAIATDRLSSAIELWSSVGARHEQSRTERALAATYAACGDPGEAVGLLWRVVASARERGAILEEKHALEQLTKLGISASATADMVKDALEAVREHRSLSGSPLLSLSRLPDGDQEVALAAHLLKSIDELCASSRPRDAEAGRVLRSYYVRRAGSHEIVAEQLHLTHSTFYRRLYQGISLVAQQLGTLTSPRQ